MENLIDKIVDGRTDLVFDFVDQYPNAQLTDRDGIPLIKWCAYYGDVSAIKYLLQNGASLNELGENYDLNGSAFHGHWQLCQFLLESGADSNYRLTDTGETALHSALCKANRPSYNLILKLLLAYNADPNAQTLPNKETGSFMRDVRTKEETPLHRAAAFADVEAIQLLLHYGADKTIKDMNGDTPLSWASWHLRPGKILSLLCYGDYNINSDRVKKVVSDHGSGWGNGMEVYLLGKVHV